MHFASNSLVLPHLNTRCLFYSKCMLVSRRVRYNKRHNPARQHQAQETDATQYKCT